MPYVITTEAPSRLDHQGVGPTVECIAVATLEEARAAAMSLVDAQPRSTAVQIIEADMLPEPGGTIGPLPDGTAIEVAPVEWDELARMAGFDLPAAVVEPVGTQVHEDILAAFNAGADDLPPAA